MIAGRFSKNAQSNLQQGGQFQRPLPLGHEHFFFFFTMRGGKLWDALNRENRPLELPLTTQDSVGRAGVHNAS